MAKKEINGTKSKEQEMKLKLSSKVTRVKSSLQGKQLSVAPETQLRKCLSCLSQVSPGTWLGCMVRSVNSIRFLMQKIKPASVYSICVENLRQTEFLQRKSDFSSHPKVLVGRAQEKPLQEAETPLEGKEAQPVSPRRRCADRAVLCAFRSQEQRPPTALPGPRLSVTLLRAPLGPSVFFAHFPRAGEGTLALAVCLKPAAKATPADPAAICGQLSPLVHGKTNSWFPVPAPRLSMHCPGASY